MEGANREGEQDRYSNEDGESDAHRPTQAELLLRYADRAGLFHTLVGDAYATFPVEGHRKTHPIRSKGFKRWLLREFYEKHSKPPGTQPLQDVLGVLEAKAQFDSPEHPVHVRVAEHDGAIYIDLSSNQWEAVKITPEGWEVVSDPPVHFRRPRGMLPLPVPSKEGKATLLRSFINLRDEDEASWRLLFPRWMLARGERLCAKP